VERENLSVLRYMCPSAIFFTISPAWATLELNLDPHHEKSATNHPSDGMALLIEEMSLKIFNGDIEW
jgi:hypothetical protein